MQENNDFRNFRKRALIDPPYDSPSFKVMAYMGHSFRPNPHAMTLVQGLIYTQWLKRGSIEVQCTGDFYILTCTHRDDVEYLIQQHRSIIDGRIITFRRSIGPQFHKV